jgi:hypothetical protein
MVSEFETFRRIGFAGIVLTALLNDTPAERTCRAFAEQRSIASKRMIHTSAESFRDHGQVTHRTPTRRSTLGALHDTTGFLPAPYHTGWPLAEQERTRRVNETPAAEESS